MQYVRESKKQYSPKRSGAELKRTARIKNKMKYYDRKIASSA